MENLLNIPNIHIIVIIGVAAINLLIITIIQYTQIVVARKEKSKALKAYSALLDKFEFTKNNDEKRTEGYKNLIDNLRKIEKHNTEVIDKQRTIIENITNIVSIFNNPIIAYTDKPHNCFEKQGSGDIKVRVKENKKYVTKVAEIGYMTDENIFVSLDDLRILFRDTINPK